MSEGPAVPIFRVQVIEIHLAYVGRKLFQYVGDCLPTDMT
jgi:hypothetical protein